MKELRIKSIYKKLCVLFDWFLHFLVFSGSHIAWFLSLNISPRAFVSKSIDHDGLRESVTGTRQEPTELSCNIAEDWLQAHFSNNTPFYACIEFADSGDERTVNSSIMRASSPVHLNIWNCRTLYSCILLKVQFLLDKSSAGDVCETQNSFRQASSLQE